MREIKFRGKGIGSNDYCYGIGYADGVIFDPVGRNTIRYHVDPESVAQLIGHDSHGNEVYEGDKLTDSQSNHYIVKFDSVVEWPSNRTPVFRRAPFDFIKEFIELTVEAE